MYIAEVLLKCSASSIGRSKEPPKPPSGNDKGELQVSEECVFIYTH